MSSFVWTVVMLTSVGLVTWGIMWIKLREMTAKARFYEGLQHLWEVISMNSGMYVAPLVDEGVAYIESVPSRRKRDYVRQEVYRLLDRSYFYYLCGLHKEVNRYLAKDDGTNWDESIHDLFVQNQHWLAYDENICDWYGTAVFEPPKTGKIPNRIREALLEQRDTCEKRLADERVAAEERRRKHEEERIKAIYEEQKIRGFWSCMSDVSG